MQKVTNEITIEVDLTQEELIVLLEKSGFKKIKDYHINDIYLVKNNFKLYKNKLDILKNCILLRDWIYDDYNIKYITYKDKKYDKNGNILSQNDYSVEVKSLSDAKQLFSVLGYEELISINDHLLIYSDSDIELAIQIVNEKYLFIEIEETDKYDVNFIKQKINELKIPIKNNNYFAKKALNVLNEKLSNCN